MKKIITIVETYNFLDDLHEELEKVSNSTIIELIDILRKFATQIAHDLENRYREHPEAAVHMDYNRTIVSYSRIETDDEYERRQRLEVLRQKAEERAIDAILTKAERKMEKAKRQYDKLKKQYRREDANSSHEF